RRCWGARRNEIRRCAAKIDTRMVGATYSNDISRLRRGLNRTNLRCLPNAVRSRTKLEEAVSASRNRGPKRFIGVENPVVVLVEEDCPALESEFPRLSLTVPVVVLINLAADWRLIESFPKSTPARLVPVNTMSSGLA